MKYRTAKKSKKQNIPADSPLLSSKVLFPAEKPHYIHHFKSAKQAFNTLIVNRDVGANRNANGEFIDSVDQLILQQVSDEQQEKQAQLIDHEFEMIKSWDDYQKQFASFAEIIDKNQDGISDNWAVENKSHATDLNFYLSTLVN